MWYCGKHDPVSKAEADAARDKKYRAESKLRHYQFQIERAAPAMIELLAEIFHGIEDIPEKSAGASCGEISYGALRKAKEIAAVLVKPQ